VALTVCLAILSTALQVLIHPSVTKNYLGLFNSFRLKDFDGIFVHTETVRDRWALDDQSEFSGISRNRLVLAEKYPIRSPERFKVSGRPWEISMRWEEGYLQRPYRDVLDKPKANTFMLVFSESDQGLYRFDLDLNAPNGCGLFVEGPEGEALPGECAPASRAALGSGPHSLTLRGENEVLTALVDGAPCASGILTESLETITIQLSTKAGSCVAFDDLTVRVEESGAGWRTLLEERFNITPFLYDRLDSMFDLGSKMSRIAATWAVLAAALLIDLAALAWFGRRDPVQALLVIALPQALSILALQDILSIPYAPLFFSVGSLWASKAMLALFWRLGPKENIRLLPWFSLCVAQVLNGFWFRELWTFVRSGSIALASLIPALLMVGLYAGAIRTGALFRICGRILIVALLVVCMELTIRSTPVQHLLDFEWRTANRFWDLQRHTILIMDHSKEEHFQDSALGIYPRQKPEGVFRIVCLGSSSTVKAASRLADPRIDNYPSQLGKVLDSCSSGRIEVINAGVGGYGLTQIRVYLEQIILDLGPDLVIFYFGLNSDMPSDIGYYKRVESLLESNPALDYPLEVEVALSLRWTHPAFVRTYRLLSQSRFFTGMKLMIDAARNRGHVRKAAPAKEDFLLESADRLVRAAVDKGVRILLIPELSAHGGSYFRSIFEEMTKRYASRPVTMYNIEGFDTSKHIVDDVHMNAGGCRELARVIADYLVGSDLVQCNSPNGST